MITIEEKLNIFSKIVLEGERKKARDKIKRIQMQNDEIIKNHLDKSKKIAEEQVQKRINEANNRKIEIVSLARMEAKRKILSKKRELLCKLQVAIENEAKRFTDTPEYETFFLNLLSKILQEVKENDDNSIYITKKDLNRFNIKVKDRLDNLNSGGRKVTLKNLDDSQIGGLALISNNKGVRIDLTIKTILEINNDLIGLMVYSSLREAGD